MVQIKSENGKTYLNHESVPVNVVQYTGSNLQEIGVYLLSLGVIQGDQIYEELGVSFLCIADSYRDVNEENPQIGDFFIIFPNKRVILYTSAEFEANFKLL